MENNPQGESEATLTATLRAGYATGLHQALDQTLATYYAEVDRLLPQHASPFNEGWLARTHGLPRYAPGSSAQPLGWIAGWDTADDTPRTYWPSTKTKLLAPAPNPAPAE